MSNLLKKLIQQVQNIYKKILKTTINLGTIEAEEDCL